MFDSTRPTLSSAPLSNLTDELSMVAEAVARMARPAEATFLALGDVLAAVIQVLEGVDRDFSNLISLLNSPDADTAGQALGDVVHRAAALAERSSRITDRFCRMETVTGAAFTPLTELAKIVGEIGALGVNARIQAAQIGSTGIDFSVFTTEIARLRSNAEIAIDKAAKRFHGVRDMVGTARASEAKVLGNDIRDIEAAKDRFGAVLGVLAERRRRAVTAAADIGERSGTISARIATCIFSMQIADRTSQRLGHIHDALLLLAAMAAGEMHQDWEENRKRALIAAACDLQARQFDHATQEFTDEVERLRSDIMALAHDLNRIAAEAATVFGADGGALFVSELHAGAEHEMVLLGRYVDSRRNMQTLVTELISELNRMSTDMDAVQDIDAEMRVIGLNASFKCGRLGSKGRTLSVIAQELRACSHRTEEASKSIVEAMKQTIGTAEWLSETVDEEQAEAASLSESLSLSVNSLARLSDKVGSNVHAVLKEWNKIADMLAEAGAAIVLHNEGAAPARHLSDRLRGLAAEGGAMMPEYDLNEDLFHLLGQHYTMDSERAVHGGFSDGESHVIDPDESVSFF